MVNSNGNGVEGKYPESLKVESKSNPLAKIEVRINGEFSGSSASGKDGIMSVPIKFQVVSEEVAI